MYVPWTCYGIWQSKAANGSWFYIKNLCCHLLKCLRHSDHITTTRLSFATHLLKYIYERVINNRWWLRTQTNAYSSTYFNKVMFCIGFHCCIWHIFATKSIFPVSIYLILENLFSHGKSHTYIPYQSTFHNLWSFRYYYNRAHSWSCSTGSILSSRKSHPKQL